ncbi:MAG: pilus assembly PilX N-terminal domain-containing protein [Candidatus Moranbacteria bacterium]|nr:pilus assembly PilX N-terminal domain-containing protein [Candidatus Moranbacteria bacterium]
MKKTKACSPMRRGSGLVFAIILLFVILGIVVTLSSITILETKMGQKTKSSVGAFYNSESGIEWALNKISNSGNNEAIKDVFTMINASTGEIACPNFGDGSPCNLYLLDKDGKVINSHNANGIKSVDEISNVKAVRSVGSNEVGEATQRSIEAAVADTGSGAGSYTAYGTTSCVSG